MINSMRICKKQHYEQHSINSLSDRIKPTQLQVTTDARNSHCHSEPPRDKLSRVRNCGCRRTEMRAPRREKRQPKRANMSHTRGGPRDHIECARCAFKKQMSDWLLRKSDSVRNICLTIFFYVRNAAAENHRMTHKFYFMIYCILKILLIGYFILRDREKVI